MANVSRQFGVLASHRLEGTYRFKDKFQLLPSAFESKMVLQDHPLILEVCFDSEAWPNRPNDGWYRDQLEQERYEHLTSNLGDQPSDSESSWLETYQQTTEMRRPGAIVSEIVSLLTLFTNFNFQHSNSVSQSWFVQPLAGDPEPIWGQKWYSFDEYTHGVELTLSSAAKASFIPYKEYYSAIKGAVYAGGENLISLPDNIDVLFQFYFSLPSVRKEGFHKACHFYCKTLELASSSASLSLVSSVMAIEALVHLESDKSKSCDVCGTPEYIETCQSCGSPTYRATSRFKNFIVKHTTDTSEMKKFAQRLYHTRSRLAHGGLLRDDLHDTGFYVSEKEEEEQLRRSARDVTRIVLINWLLRIGSEVTS